ncbi:hypothetical protein C2S51_032068 [Perilla frutescens var. frutescens]|nr:hypothetical protein C2S51_032068 [Perilla frutescens var. frutescens]
MAGLTADEEVEIDLNSLVGGHEQSSTIKLTQASFWIRAYDLSVSCLNLQVVKTLANFVGSFVELDDNFDDYVGNYLRMKMVLDVTKSILRGLTIKLEGNKLWIPLKIESLLSFCFGFGIIGHHLKQCPSEEKGHIIT